MNREHNTGGDECGGGLEGGIALFWHSWEENNCISLLIFWPRECIGASPLALRISALYSWAQTAWHSYAWRQCAYVLQFWLLANRKQLYTLLMKALWKKNPLVGFPPINTRFVQWFYPVSALYFSTIVQGYEWKPAFERWTCGKSRYACSKVGMLQLARNIWRFIILREPLLPCQSFHSSSIAS